ncbi:MAG: ribosome maturation factor RimM [Bacillota bacterium]
MTDILDINDEQNLIAVGRIVRYQGNKGEVRVVPLTDYPERFFEYDRLILERATGNEELKVEKVREHKGFIVLKLETIDDIGAAEAIKDHLISIPITELPQLPEDSFYIFELKGLEVRTDTGTRLGKITAVSTDTGTDILQVQGEERDYLIPVAKEIIISIDQDEGIVTIKPIPGLLEL